MFASCATYCLCVGVVRIRKGVITVDSFDKLAELVLTGLCMCACVYMRECVDTCMLSMSLLYKGGAGLVGGQEKVQSWVAQHNKHGNILNIFTNKPQPRT